MSYFLCPDCGNVFDSKSIKVEEHSYTQPCVISSCYGEMFECDEEMLIPIMMLNDKGYYTNYCCSGHTFGSCGGYIKFNEYCTLPDSVPKGWHKDDGNCIRYSFKKNSTAIETMKTIHRRIESLTKWCEELEFSEEFF